MSMILSRILIALMLVIAGGCAPALAQDVAPDKKAQLLVVLIYDESCTVSCSVVKPIVRDLATQQQIQYEEFNTSPKELSAALAKAKKFKMETFVSDRTEEVPVVGIFTVKGKRLKELSGRKTKEVYKEAIEKALEKVKS
jgi:hypothetical protein